MGKKRKRYTKKNVYQAAIPAIFLFLIVTALAYVIMQTEWLRPKINEITASYISLNTTETTDVLKITNLHKLSDIQGKRNSNRKSQTFQITGEKDTTYQIVLYHLGNKIDEKQVHFYLTNEQGDKMEGILSSKEQTNDGGRIVFEGTMKDGKKWNLKMWIDRSYPKDANNISYEIKIKTR